METMNYRYLNKLGAICSESEKVRKMRFATPSVTDYHKIYKGLGLLRILIAIQPEYLIIFF